MYFIIDICDSLSRGMSLNQNNAFCFGFILMPDFSKIDIRCLDSWHILISSQFKHGYPLNISCSKIFDSCKIKRMVTYLTQLGYVNNYDKNRYLEKISKAAVHRVNLVGGVSTCNGHFVYLN